jgi:type II secretion system protein L
MLRVFLSEAADVGRTVPWVRYAPDGRVLTEGRDVPAHWPADAQTEIVLAAARARLVTLTLPPMPRERLHAAARFALEDQIATSVEEAALALGESRNGALAVAVASQALVDALAQLPRVTRIVPESALAPFGAGWTWCRSEAGDGFVRREDGSAFPVGQVRDGDGALPPELAAALAHAARGGTPPAVHVAFACDAAQIARWSGARGVRFVASREWDWRHAGRTAFASAPDFLEARLRNTRAARVSSQAFSPALALAALAVLVHLGALLGQWGWLRVENWRLSRALVAQAEATGATRSFSSADAALAIARRNAELRHRAGRDAPADALPLLARSAPALGALPAGALRSARYVDDAWTIEIGRLDPVALSRVTHALGAAGMDAVAAPTPAGSRMRLSLGALAR